VRRAKRMALPLMKSNIYDEPYKRLPEYVEMLKARNPRSIARVK